MALYKCVVIIIIIMFSELSVLVKFSSGDCLENLISQMDLLFVEWDVKLY